MNAAQKRETLMLKSLLKETRYLKPVFDFNFGYRYTVVEETLGLPPREVRRVLDKLSEEGFLEKSVYRVVLKCPVCGMHALVTLVSCAACGGNRLERRELVQHYSCGYSGFKDEFEVAEESTCPYCHEKIAEKRGEFGEKGVLYRCLDCGETFGEPNDTWFCAGCGIEFSGEKAEIENIYVYEINVGKVRSELPEIGIEGIEDVFGDVADVFIPGCVTGKSGVKYDFSALLVGKKGSLAGKRAVINGEFSAEEVSEDAVTRFFAKFVDVGSCLPLLIAIPRLSDGARELAKAYNIMVIEGEDPAKMENKLRENRKCILKKLEGLKKM